MFDNNRNTENKMVDKMNINHYTGNMKIIYDGNNNERYLLGTKGKNTLLCICINPSTAIVIDENLEDDPTIKRLEKIASKKYDSWIMINIYPQRATKPRYLHKNMDKNIHDKNLQIIRNLIKNDSNILCAWGVSITKRSYLKYCLKDIYDIMHKKNIDYFRIGDFTNGKHPRHISPQSINNESIEKGLIKFDLDDYIKNLFNR